MNLLYNEEENNLEIFAKYQNFDFDLNDSNDIPCEQWVNEYLHAKYHDKIQLNDIEIIWFNEKLEQEKSYDFILKNLKMNIITDIEVKNTLSNNRQLIPIIYNELQLCIVENLEEKLHKHDLELFLLI
ncbi:unnamed protein product [Rotaria sp. Silwood1]|nr:unnamed protein product [Rotaria sp. Silwood1]CAF1654933.1 unnamed protein product [Rotaria sp. Silwood1]